jgi:hypothetical protein
MFNGFYNHTLPTNKRYWCPNCKRKKAYGWRSKEPIRYGCDNCGSLFTKEQIQECNNSVGYVTKKVIKNKSRVIKNGKTKNTK